MNSANGELIIQEVNWANKEELWNSSFTKEEHLQMAYDNLLKAWTDEKRARIERERRD